MKLYAVFSFNLCHVWYVSRLAVCIHAMFIMEQKLDALMAKVPGSTTELEKFSSSLRQEMNAAQERTMKQFSKWMARPRTSSGKNGMSINSILTLRSKTPLTLQKLKLVKAGSKTINPKAKEALKRAESSLYQSFSHPAKKYEDSGLLKSELVNGKTQHGRPLDRCSRGQKGNCQVQERSQ